MDVSKVKNVRRAAKGALTRAITNGKELIDAERPVIEVTEVLTLSKLPTKRWKLNTKSLQCF